MIKKIVLALLIGLQICSFSLIAAELVDAGNKMCPVSGDDVSGKTFVEYQGKRYGLCCKMCADKFNKNPEKFIGMLEKGAAEGHSSHKH